MLRIAYELLITYYVAFVDLCYALQY